MKAMKWQLEVAEMLRSGQDILITTAIAMVVQSMLRTKQMTMSMMVIMWL